MYRDVGFGVRLRCRRDGRGNPGLNAVFRLFFAFVRKRASRTEAVGRVLPTSGSGSGALLLLLLLPVALIFFVFVLSGFAVLLPVCRHEVVRHSGSGWHWHWQVLDRFVDMGLWLGSFTSEGLFRVDQVLTSRLLDGRAAHITALDTSRRISLHPGGGPGLGYGVALDMAIWT